MRLGRLETVLFCIALAAAFVLTLSPAQSAAAARSHSSCCRLSEAQPPVEKTFAVSGAAELQVNNITGPIRVVGDSPAAIRLTATETVRGNTAGDLDRARREVALDTVQEGNRVMACVNGRGGDNGVEGNRACRRGFGEGSRDYETEYDFVLHVPATTEVTLRTVTGGSLTVEAVSGRFDLKNVNGGIDLEGAAGAGSAATVNGDIRAGFAAPPRADCSFKTINGALHLYFPASLAARLQYRTLNGDVYSDFAVQTPPSSSRRSLLGRGADGEGQVGGDGPNIALNTLNGNIFIHRAN